MAKLKFNCCAWECSEGVHGRIKNAAVRKAYPSYYISVSMYGIAEKQDETGHYYIEKDASKIDSFWVEVEVLDI